jgi:hypothetical protein
MSMFRITNNKGFQMTFENGWTISVQFGYGNYCSHRNHESTKEIHQCPNAEITIWGPDGQDYDFGGGDNNAKGYCSADEVATWIQFTANLGK